MVTNIYISNGGVVMSMGIGGYAQLIYMKMDSECFAYGYGSYNLNDEQYKNDEKKHDGKIYIDRAAFIEPEIHRKRKKLPNGRIKIVEKRVAKPINPQKLISEGLIKVVNTSNCWETDKAGIDVMALLLIDKLIMEYQMEGRVPDRAAYDK